MAGVVLRLPHLPASSLRPSLRRTGQKIRWNMLYKCPGRARDLSGRILCRNGWVLAGFGIRLDILACTCVGMRVDFFNEAGWLLRKTQGGARTLVAHKHYVIGSNPKRVSSKPENSWSHSYRTPG